MTEIKQTHCLSGGHESLCTGLQSLDEIENILTLVASDEAIEIAAGSNVEWVPTLAFGSYCFTCTNLFDEQ